MTAGEIERFRKIEAIFDAVLELPPGPERDAFLRRQEMVIKPLAPYLANLPGISGASILGDGGVVLILDPAELLMLAVEEAL